MTADTAATDRVTRDDFTSAARWLAGQCDWFATLPRLTREDATLFADAGRMLAALADALDAARQTIGVQQAALDGAATTVERYEAEVARLREAMPAAIAAEADAKLELLIAASEYAAFNETVASGGEQ